MGGRFICFRDKFLCVIPSLDPRATAALDIDGESAGDQAGQTIAMSEDGRYLAVSAPYADVNGDVATGRVRIFQLDGSTWSQLGADIIGDTALHYLGNGGLSMSADGSRLAIGSYTAAARVYEFDGSNWTQLGDDVAFDYSQGSSAAKHLLGTAP